jgi:PAS domain S-box-containing protein
MGARGGESPRAGPADDGPGGGAQGTEAERQPPPEERVDLLQGQLHLSRAQWELAAAFVEEPIYFADLDDRFLLVNEAFQRLAKLPREQILGRSVLEVLHPNGGGGDCPVCLARQARRDCQLRVEADAPGNSLRRPLDVTVRMLQDRGGAPVAVMTGVRDLTYARESEARLDAMARERELAEERFRTAFLTTPDALAIQAMPGGRYVLVNPGFTRITGWGEAEALGKTPEQLHLYWDPADRQRLIDVIREQGQLDNLEVQYRGKDGRQIQGLASTRPIAIGGVPHQLGIFRDISGLKRAEAARDQLAAQLLQARKMEAIGRLAGGVAHDFNNLLTTILGVAELLIEDHPPDSEVVRDARAIRDAGQLAANLTKQLLAFSRQQRLEMQVLRFDEICRSFSGMLRRLIGDEVVLELDLRAPQLAVMVDKAQIEQVLLNLAVNARDAMPGGGTITFSTRLATEELPAALRPGRYLLFSAQDTGTGMPPEVVARVFEPFFTTKESGKGTGLGLAMVHGVVVQHGGHIQVQSEPGKGTRFDLWFPEADAAEATAAEPARPHGEKRGSGTVLVVDDEPSVRQLVRRVLYRVGYRVEEAASGDEARRRLDAGLHVDLLLVDVAMPGLRGPELAALFRAMRPGRPVLYMSGYAADLMAREPQALLINKPLHPAELVERVAAVLAG